MKIRIVSIPPGEAPEHVRAAWVGITLPTAIAGAHTRETVGVLSGPVTWFGLLLARIFRRTHRQRGYIVDAHEAVEILAASSPDAAKWWREIASHSVQPGQYFMFHDFVCEELGS